jgi:hypothetical protein
MDDSMNNIIKAVLALLGNLFVYLKNLLTAVLGYCFKQEPELNKPLDKKIISPDKEKLFTLRCVVANPDADLYS